MFFETRARNKYVPKTKRELLFYRQNGKCAGCKRTFESIGVSPRLHHVGKTSRISDLQLLCPACHDKAHAWKTKIVPLVGKDRVMVRKRLGKKKATKKHRGKKSRKRSMSPYSTIFG